MMLRDRVLKIFFIVALLLTSFHFIGGVADANYYYDVKILVNGKDIKSDVPPFIDGRYSLTYVPIRFVSEALGAKVDWYYSNQYVTIDRLERLIAIQIGSKKASVTIRGIPSSTQKEVVLEGPAQLVNNRTFVPLRFVSEALGAKVTWEGKTRTVLIEDSGVGENTSGENPDRAKYYYWEPPSNPEKFNLAKKMFSLISYDEVNKTLTVTVPNFGPGVDINYYYDDGKKITYLEAGKTYTFSGSFAVGMNVDNGVLQSYTIYSDSSNPLIYEITRNVPGDLGPVVIGSGTKVFTLDAVLKGLGLK